MLITYTVEIIKILSTVSVKKWLLFCMSAIIIMLVLILNIYFGNFLKIPMKMSMDEKISFFKEFKKKLNYRTAEFGKILTNVVGFDCDYNIVILDWHFTSPPKNYIELNATYITVSKYTENQLEDRMHLLNDKGQSPNKHDYKSAQTNYEQNFNEGSATYQTIENYINQSGVAVTNMINNYPFQPYSKIGATIITNLDERKALRFVLMSDEECTKRINQKDYRSLIMNEMTRLRDDVKNTILQ